MPSASLTAASYAYGGWYDTPNWQTDTPSFALPNYYSMAFVRFTGATDVMALTLNNAIINSAVLTISGISQPPSPESLTISLDVASADYPNPPLPVDLNDAMDTNVGNPVTANVQNLMTVDVDVAAALTEALGNFISGGDVIMFKVHNPNYSGSAISGMTATLAVTWTVVTPSQPEATAPDINATASVDVATAVISPVATAPEISATASVEAADAVTAALATAPDIASTASVEPADAILPPVATAPDIATTASVEPAFTAIIATAPDISVTASIETTTAIVPPIATAPEISVTASIESNTAVTLPVATALDISVTATVQPARRVAGWRTATPSNITLTASGAK